MSTPTILEKQESIGSKIRTEYRANSKTWSWKSVTREKFLKRTAKLALDISSSEFFTSSLLKATKYYVESASQLRGFEHYRMELENAFDPSSVLIRRHNPGIEASSALSDVSSFMAIALSKAYAAWIVYDLSKKSQDTISASDLTRNKKSTVTEGATFALLQNSSEDHNVRQQLLEALNQNLQLMLEVAQDDSQNADKGEQIMDRISGDFDAKINKILEKLGIKKVPEKMKNTLPFAAFDYKNNEVLTTFSELEYEYDDSRKREFLNGDGADKLNLLIMDIPLPSLSAEQIAEYQSINIGISTGSGGNPSWYEKLSDFEKSLMERYKDKVCNPDLLRSKSLVNLPGLRNAALESSQVFLGDQVLSTGTEIHSGAFATFKINNAMERQRLTEQNIDHVQALFPEQDIRIELLTSKQFGCEKKIYEAIKGATRNMQRVIFNNLAINATAFLPGSRDYSDMLKILQKIADPQVFKEGALNSHEKTLHKAFQTILKTGKSAKSLRISRGNLKIFQQKLKHHQSCNSGKNEKFIKIMEDAAKLMMALKERPNKIRKIFNVLKRMLGFKAPAQKNSNFRAITAFDILIHSMKTASDSFSKKTQETINCIQCKSGKDRTAIRRIDCMSNKIVADLRDRGIYINKSSLWLHIAQKGHVQFYNANYGNTPGAWGILKNNNIASYLDRSISKVVRKYLMRKTANNGKFRPKKSASVNFASAKALRPNAISIPTFEI